MSTPTTDEIDPSMFDPPPVPALDIDPEPAQGMRDLLPTAQDVYDVARASAPPLAIAEVLPPDFPLPALVRWLPNQGLRRDLQRVTGDALGIDVRGAGGLQAADLALGALRSTIKAVEVHFEEPADIAHRLHKRITGLRGEWLKDATDTVQVVGRRIAVEKQRLDAIAAEQRRKDQEKSDAEARTQRAREAEAAAKQGAPEPIVQQMRQAAAVATAAPVPVAPIVPTLASSTVTKTWKARVKGTPADADQNPSTADLTGPQKAQVYELLAAIIAGHQPIALIDLNWSAINARARAEKGTLTIPGIEAYEDIGTRAKPGRRA